MNFKFSSEQEVLRDQVRRLTQDGLHRARIALDTHSGLDKELWSACVEMGLAGAAVPESQGGSALGALELCVISEELGRSLAPVPLASSILLTIEALKLGGGPLADEWLPRLARGTAIGTLALSEGRFGSWDTPPVSTIQRQQLTGTKQPVVDATLADFAIVSARAPEDGDSYSWWLAPMGSASINSLVAIDRIRKFAVVDFDRVPAQRLSAPRQGPALTAQLLNIAATLVAFEQLGGAEAMLHNTVEYAKQRRAFGSLIGVNQAVKHRLADIYVKLQLARGHCYYAAWALASDATKLPLAAAGARLAATDAFCFAAEEGLELHGAIGFTWEHDCSLYLRRARLLAQQLGNTMRWSDALVSSLITAGAA